MNPSARASIWGVAGGYLIYLAYQLLKNLIDKVQSELPPWLAILAIILFAGSGAGLLFLAWKTWKQSREEQDKDPVEITVEESGNDCDRTAPRV